MSRRKYKEICIGDIYNNWKVLSFDCVKHGHKYYMCECQCENKTVKSVCGDYLVSGRSKNCGCSRNKNNAIRCSELGKQWGFINGKEFGSKNVRFAYEANKKFNNFHSFDDKIIIILHNNTELTTIIDKEDWTDNLRNKCWSISSKGYVRCLGTAESIHRIIMDCNDVNYDVHHIDGNKLNNCKDNLIVLSHTTHTLLHNYIDKVGKLLSRNEIEDFINKK